jgi:hypothetical protein
LEGWKQEDDFALSGSPQINGFFFFRKSVHSNWIIIIIFLLNYDHHHSCSTGKWDAAISHSSGNYKRASSLRFQYKFQDLGIPRWRCHQEIVL